MICFNEEKRSIDPLGHNEVIVERCEPTCTEDGYEQGIYCDLCDTVLSGLEIVDALGHTKVIDPAIEATESSPGRTEGKHCLVCGEVLIKQQIVVLGDYSNAYLYDGDYAYNSLLTLEKGIDLRSFYNDIDVVADEFHASLEDAKIEEKWRKQVLLCGRN